MTALHDVHPTSRDAVELQIQDVWSQVLDVQDVGVHDDFFELGGDSLLALKVIVALRRRGCQLDYRAMLHAPTVAKLAELLRRGQRGPTSSLVPIKSTGSRRPLFCFHPIGGSVLWYAGMARALGRDQPVYGLQARGLDPSLDPHETIPEMVSSYLTEMRTVQPPGPYLLLGYSMGGVVAFEAACQLAAGGHEVGRLIMVDTHPAEETAADPQLATRALVRHVLGLSLDVEELCQLDPGERSRRILDEALAKDVLPADYGTEHLLRMLRLYEVNRSALARYDPPAFPGTVTLLRTAGDSGLDDDDTGWRRYARDVVALEVPGDHFTVLHPEHLPAMASVLAALL